MNSSITSSSVAARTTRAPVLSGTCPTRDALTLVLRYLTASSYRFTTTTPLTHERVLKNRSARLATTLLDVFGWNVPFESGILSPALLATMDRAGVLQPYGKLQRSTVRVATLGEDLFLHSAFPTIDDAAVFFGPDTYRFVRFINESLGPRAHAATGLKDRPGPVRILDVGCGSGAGGIAAVRRISPMGSVSELVMNDLNPLALLYTAVNAEVAGIPVLLAPGDALSAVEGEFDLIVSNPPYMADAAHRTYRDGGDKMGSALSSRIAKEALSRLAPGGQLILYTGVAMIDGVDPFLSELTPVLAGADCEWSYCEIDPDVFGEELELPAYAHVDRIAAVGLHVLNTRGF